MRQLIFKNIVTLYIEVEMLIFLHIYVENSNMSIPK